MFNDLARTSVAQSDLSGEMANFDSYGVAGSPGGGPYLELWLKFDGDLVTDATYRCNGCPSITTTGATLARICCGRDVEKLGAMEPSDIDALVGGLPEGKGYCADMAIQALRMALAG